MAEKKKPHPLHRAWAAGVFEARVAWPAKGYALQFESVNEEMIKRFHEIVEVGKVTDRVHKNRLRPLFMFKTYTMDDTRELLRLLSPFFSGGNKITQAAHMLARIERHPLWKKRHPEKATSSVLASPAPTADQKTT